MSLAVALRLPGQDALQGWAVYFVMATCYLFNGYFAFVNTIFAQNLIKRIQKRLDFSIDIFSPHLDLPKHIVRRIKQETISVLLLADPEYSVQERRPLNFRGVCARGHEIVDWTASPPYLLSFRGSQGERHIENLKVDT